MLRNTAMLKIGLRPLFISDLAYRSLRNGFIHHQRADKLAAFIEAIQLVDLQNRKHAGYCQTKSGAQDKINLNPQNSGWSYAEDLNI